MKGALICTIAALISLPLGIYFHFAGVRTRELTWYAYPLRTNVIAIEDRSQLQVRFDGQEVRGNVTAVQIALWNAGNQPIKTEDIYESVRLNSSPPVRILEAKVRKEMRSVSNIAVDLTRRAEGELVFSWRVLEHNDGALIQLLFEGDPDARFTMSGAIAEQVAIHHPELVKPSTANDRQKLLTTINRNVVWVSVVACLSIGLIGLAYFRSEPSWTRWLVLIGSCALIVSMARNTFQLVWSPTPFYF